MPRTTIPGSLIRDDTVESVDIKDATIIRDDINTTSTGKALITKVLSSTGIHLESTGVDSGTGDVTINVSQNDIEFKNLYDTPATYVNQGNKILKIDETESGIEYGANLEDLSDTNIEAPSNQQYIIWNSSTGSWILANTLLGSGLAYEEYFIATSGQTQVTLSIVPESTKSLFLCVNGLTVADDEYSLVHDTITFNYTLKDNDKVLVKYGTYSVLTDQIIYMTDMPGSYVNSGGKVLVVNNTSTGIVFSEDITINSINSEDIIVNNNLSMNTYSETVTTATTSTGSYSIDLSLGTVFDITIKANTTFSITNADSGGRNFTLILRQDTTGGYTTTWPSSVKWSGDLEPLLTTTLSTTSILTFLSIDSGTTWYGSLSGTGYPA